MDGAATATHSQHRPDCRCWSPKARPCFVDEWAAQRIGPEPLEEWTFIVEMGGGQWRVRRKPDGSLEYEHTSF